MLYDKSTILQIKIKITWSLQRVQIELYRNEKQKLPFGMLSEVSAWLSHAGAHALD